MHVLQIIRLYRVLRELFNASNALKTNLVLGFSHNVNRAHKCLKLLVTHIVHRL
jgi:hypothetical protein